jgi:hypothetical protein
MPIQPIVPNLPVPLGAPDGIAKPISGQAGLWAVWLSTTARSGLDAIADGYILSNISGQVAVPIGNSLSDTMDYDLGSTPDGFAFRNSTGWTEGTFVAGAGISITYGASTVTIAATGSGGDGWLLVVNGDVPVGIVCTPDGLPLYVPGPPN